MQIAWNAFLICNTVKYGKLVWLIINCQWKIYLISLYYMLVFSLILKVSFIIFKYFLPAVYQSNIYFQWNKTHDKRLNFWNIKISRTRVYFQISARVFNQDVWKNIIFLVTFFSVHLVSFQSVSLWYSNLHYVAVWVHKDQHIFGPKKVGASMKLLIYFMGKCYN